MAEPIDRLEVELTTNFQELISELRKIDDATDELVREFQQAENITDDLAKSFQRTSLQSMNLEGNFNEIAKGLDDMATETNGLSNVLDGLNESADAAGEKFSGMLSSIKDMTAPVFAAITGITASVTAFGIAATAASDEAAEAMRTIAYETGLVETELEKYSNMVRNMSLLGGHSQEEYAYAYAKVSALNRGADDETVAALSNEYLSFLEMRPEASIDSVDAAFKKWGIATEEQAEYLRAFNSIAQTTTVDIATLTQTLADGDRAFQMMGMSMLEAASYIGESKYAGEIDDVRELINAIEMLQAQKASELGSDEAGARYIADLTANIKSMDNELEALAYLTGETMNLSDKVARAFAASMFSSADSTEKTFKTATEAMTHSLVDLEKEFETAGDIVDRIGRNMAEAFVPVGESIKDNMLTPIDRFMQLANFEGFDVALSDYGEYWAEHTLTDKGKAMFMQETNTAGGGDIFTTLIDKLTEVNNSIRSIEPTVNHNITINQTNNSPTPLDTVRIQQATERAAKVASKSVFGAY